MEMSGKDRGAGKRGQREDGVGRRPPICWEGLEKIEEDRVVELVPMMKGGGNKKEKARNPWESSASEFGKDETDRSGEDRLEEQGCMAVLDDLLNKARKDGGSMNEIIETMALLGQVERKCSCALEKLCLQRSARQEGVEEESQQTGRRLATDER